jgi:hypothetical protein
MLCYLDWVIYKNILVFNINIEKEKRGIVDEICSIQLDSNPHKFQNKSALMVKKNLLQKTNLKILSISFFFFTYFLYVLNLYQTKAYIQNG